MNRRDNKSIQQRLGDQARRDERQHHDSEIATCQCGAQVRKGLDGVWLHSGPCSTLRFPYKNPPNF